MIEQNSPNIIHETEQTEAEKSRRGFLFRFTKGLLVSLLSVILFLAFCIVLVIEVKPVRQWVLSLVIDQVNSGLLGKVSVGDFEIDWTQGLTITKVTIVSQNGDTVAVIPKLVVNADVEAISRQKLSIGCVSLEKARIRMIRGRDSVWNYELVAKPSEDTTTSKPFDWDITLGSLELRNCSLTRYDSTFIPPPFRSAFNFDKMRLEQLNCTIAGAANIAKKKFDIRLSDLAFVEVMSGFVMNELTLNANVSQQGTHLTQLAINTPRMDAGIEIHVNDDIFKGFDPDSTKLFVSIDSDRFSGEDLCAFLPYANFTGTYNLELQANGVLNDLAITEIDAHTRVSSLKAKGRLRNITRGDKLTFEAWLSKSFINYDEVRKNAVVLSLPELDFLGTAHITKGYVFGYPKDSLYFDFQPITVNSGTAAGKLTLYLRDTLGYTADLTYEHLNLAPIAHSDELRSNLNGSVKAKGKGFDLGELSTEAEMFSHHSSIAGRYYNRLIFKGGAHDGGVVRIDTLRLGIADSTVADSIDVFADEKFSHLGCKGTFDFRNLHYPTYNLSLAYHNVNIGYLAADPSLNLTLSGNAYADFVGFHPDSLQGTLKASIWQFQLKDRSLMPFDLSIGIDRNGRSRNIAIHSTPIDAEIQGEFSILGIVSRISSNVQSFANEVKEKVNSIRGVKASVSESKTLSRGKPAAKNNDMFNSKPANLRFAITCREFSPIELFTPDISFDVRGIVKGSIKGDVKSSDFIIDTLMVPFANIKTGETSIRTQMVKMSLRTRLNHILDSSFIDYLSVQAACDTQLSVNDITLKSPYVNVILRKNIADITLRSSVNDMLHASIKGNVSVEEKALGFTFSDLLVGYGGREWQIRRELLGNVSADGIRFRQCELFRTNAENIVMNGQISNRSFSGFGIKITNFSLPDLMSFPFMTPSVKELLKTLEGRVDTVHLQANGSFDNPEMKLRGNIKALSYNKVFIGDQIVDAISKDAVITGSTSIVNSTIVGKPTTLFANIHSLPLNIALKDIENRWSKTKPIDITATAKELSLAVIAPFIPGVTKVNGLADAEISVKGIVGKEINYGGTARFYKASFLTLSSNLMYRAAGKMTLRNNTVTIDTVLVANDANDYPKGRALVTGSVLVDGFDIQYLDMTIRSQELMVLSAASEATMPTMYGKFVIGSGKNPIHLRGSLDKPQLTGDVVVRDADITMPPDKKFQKRISIFRYERDTVVGKHKYSITTAPETVQQTTESKTVTAQVKKESQRINAGLVDKMKYDLNVSIVPNKFKLTMILGNFEKLIAYVNPRDKTIPLQFRREPFGAFQMFGELIVQDKSTYEFVKLLSAGGSLNFETGQLDNPRMNLTAVLNQKRTFNNAQQPYSVKVKIEGTKKQPIVTFTYQIDGIEGTGTKEEITENALMLLVFARTKQELFGAQSGQGGSLVGDLSGSASSLITSQLGTLLQGTFISEANINFNGTVGDISNANVSLAGQLIGDVQWRVGGNIGDLASNNTFSIDIPLSAFFDKEFLDNLVLQLTTSAVNNNTSANALRQQKLWEVKIGWRYSF